MLLKISTKVDIGIHKKTPCLSTEGFEKGVSLLVLLVAHTIDRAIPTSSAALARVSLLGSGAGETFFRDSANLHTQPLSHGIGSGAVNHIGRETDTKIVGEWSFNLFDVIRDDTVFSGGKPEFDMRKILCNLHDLLKVRNILEVAAIMPAKESALFLFVNQKGHGICPQRISQWMKAFFHSINHVLENIAAFEGIALGANAFLYLAKQRANFATKGWCWICVTWHLARCGKRVNNCLGFFDSGEGSSHNAQRIWRNDGQGKKFFSWSSNTTRK